MTAPLVEMRDMVKSFGGIKAVDHVTIDLYPGEVVGVPGHNGAGKSVLMEVLSGAVALKDAVQTPNRFRFDILLGNDTTANPADILSSKQFSQFVDDAREIYDVIIFDTPPLLVVSDARIVGQYADAILFAVLWNKTSQPQVVDAIRELSSVGLNVTGTVLSNIDPAGIKKFGYGDRYGAYDSRTGRGYHKN